MVDIVFGDNHLFGINHLSMDKAQQYQEKFRDSDALLNIFEMLKSNGINEQMISAHERAAEICQLAINAHSRLIFHPIIPYAHAINDMAASQGVIRTTANLLRPTFSDFLRLAAQLFLPTCTLKIPRSSIKRFIDAQLNMFGSLPRRNRGTLFLNNVFTDLLIGMGAVEWFELYQELCASRGFKAGVITYNPSFFFKNRFNLDSICINHNHVGFLTNIRDDELSEMSNWYSVWAMGVFGSGAYTEADVINDLGKKYFSKVVFASSREDRLVTFIRGIRKDA